MKYIPEIIMTLLITIKNVALIGCMTWLAYTLYLHTRSLWALLPLLGLLCLGGIQFSRN